MKNYDKYLQQIKLTNKKIENLKLQFSKNDNNNYLFYNSDILNNYIYALYSILQYSPSNLKYSRKIELTLNNNDYFFNISDIHVEIDFNLLGVNECNIFHELFLHIKDNLLHNKEFIIIMCLNFENIKKELLKIFYSFMNENNIKFIFISNQVSFLEENILNNVIIKRIDNNTNLYNNNEMYKNHIDVIVNAIIHKNKKILEIRDKLYELLIKNYNIHDCINYLIEKLIEKNYIHQENNVIIFKNIIHILKKYNNNYRSIFHLERLIIYLININND